MTADLNKGCNNGIRVREFEQHCSHVREELGRLHHLVDRISEEVASIRESVNELQRSFAAHRAAQSVRWESEHRRRLMLARLLPIVILLAALMAGFTSGAFFAPTEAQVKQYIVQVISEICSTALP